VRDLKAGMELRKWYWCYDPKGNVIFLRRWTGEYSHEIDWEGKFPSLRNQDLWVNLGMLKAT